MIQRGSLVNKLLMMILATTLILVAGGCGNHPKPLTLPPSRTTDSGPVDAAISAFQGRIQFLAKEQPELLGQIFRQVYGVKITADKQAELIELARRGAFPLPQIHLVDSTVLQGAFGASAREGSGIVLLSKSLTEAPELLLAMLIEELGHDLDTRLGGADTAGDEGQMFLTAVANGALLGREELDMARGEKDHGTITVGQRVLRAEFAAPALPAAIYLSKAVGATAVDTFLEYAIAAFTGTPPTILTHVGNFAANLTPALGEARKVEKLTRLGKVIDVVIDTAKALEKADVKGAKMLLMDMRKHKDNLIQAVQSGSLSKAKGHFNNIIGSLREVQVASRLQGKGAAIKSLREILKDKAGNPITDIDVISDEGGQLFVNQIKAGRRAVIGKGSGSWEGFDQQLRMTMEYAAERGAKVRYYVDDVSPEVLDYLGRESKVEVIMNAEFL